MTRNRTTRILALRLALLAGALLAALVSITFHALEAGGVARIETRTGTGEVRRTHVWYAELEGRIWLEAGSPDNGWVEDIERAPLLVFSTSSGARQSLRAVPIRDPSVHRRLRARLREKYGWRDRWVGLFVDASRSFAVRLEPDADRAQGSFE